MRVRVSSKGQIVLPAAIRKKYDAAPGAEWVLVDMGDYVALVPRSKDPIHEAYGMFKDDSGVSVVDEFLRERREDDERSEAKFRRLFGDK
jgi:AbrB family looped-hinge helix DNA binding protein